MEIRQVTLYTSKLEQLARFYSELLRLPLVRDDESIITTGIGSTKLVFKQTSTADPFYHFAINIPANKIEEATSWLSERVKLLWIEQYQSNIADFVTWRARSVYFYDPAGNIVELIARFDLCNESDLPFCPRQFLSISEVGLVVKPEELERTTASLLEQYQLSYFDKQAPLPQFKAVGDDKGLFIVVPEKRTWFPTTRPSAAFPMEIEFENNGKQLQWKC